MGGTAAERLVETMTVRMQNPGATHGDYHWIYRSRRQDGRLSPRRAHHSCGPAGHGQKRLWHLEQQAIRRPGSLLQPRNDSRGADPRAPSRMPFSTTATPSPISTSSPVGSRSSRRSGSSMPSASLTFPSRSTRRLAYRFSRSQHGQGSTSNLCGVRVKTSTWSWSTTSIWSAQVIATAATRSRR